MTTPHDRIIDQAPSRGQRVLRASRYLLAILVLVFAVVTYDVGNPRWGVLSVAIGLSVLVAQFINVPLLRVYGIWLGIFYVLQSLVSPLIIDDDFKTLTPNIDQKFDVAQGLPGIEGVQHLTTDALGFRTTKSIDYDNPAPLRIFAIGGSTTEQLFLDDRETSSHLLQVLLEANLNAPVEVINTGVSGLRAIHHVATLRVTSGYHPDIALILIGVNDWNLHIATANRDIGTGEYEPFATSLLQQLKLRQTLAGTVIERIQAALAPSDISQASGKKTLRYLDQGGDFRFPRGSLALDKKIEFRPSSVSAPYAKSLRKIMAECRKLAVTCVFATQPHGYQAGADADFKTSFWGTPPLESYTLTFDSMGHIAETYNRYLQAQADENGFPMCDIAAGMAPSFANFYDDVHFNENGARRAAALLLPCVLPVAQRVLMNKGQ